MEAEVCVDNKKNLGVVRCSKLPSMPRGMITTSEDFEIPTATLEDPELLEAYLQDALKAGSATRVYLWPFFVGFEDASEDAVYEETALADLKVRDGKYRFRFMIQKNLCMHKAMFTHRANGGRAFLFDIENQLTGTITSTGMRGFSISLLNTEKLKISDGTVSTKSPIYLVLSNNKELDADGGLVDASFVNTLKRLTDVVITMAAAPAATASSIRVEVKTECDGTPIDGLLVADFVGTDALGAAIVINTSTPVSGSPGNYTLASTADFEDDGEITLRAASLLTVEAYEVPEGNQLVLVIP